mmetsp:Transcript_90193/g.156307  ORF Transcript_90193/g.156307 Transcript_90193/m.156307 type:complete len:83 (-) Transcript_90193:133-381(-)
MHGFAAVCEVAHAANVGLLGIRCTTVALGQRLGAAQAGIEGESLWLAPRDRFKLCCGMRELLGVTAGAAARPAEKSGVPRTP